MEVSSTRRRSRRMVSEINVVPYIDVMLVLLIIFMTTAPLLTEGVEVELPKASANVVESEDEIDRVIVSVDGFGNYFVNDDETPVALTTVTEKAAAFIADKPDTTFYVKGDASVPYEKVIKAMTALQAGGVPSVGLVTEPEPTNQSDN